MQPRKAPPPRAPAAHAESVELDADGGLRLVVVADTHSHTHPKIMDHLARIAPKAILHAGDIGDLSVLEQLRKAAPLIAVRGNIDDQTSDVADVVTIDVRAKGQSVLKMLLTHIAVYGPKIRAEVARAAHEAEARLIVCGHSHVPFIGRDKGLTVFNPGSIGPRRMHLPIVFGLLEIREGKLSLSHVSCETGEPWQP